MEEELLNVSLLDRESIKGIPWAENMWTVLENNLTKTFLYWCQMVLKMGESEEVIKEWVDIFIKEHEETCSELVADMERVKRNVLQKIEQLLQEFEKLCHTLQIKMPKELGDTTQQLSLHAEQHQLKNRIDEYKKLIDAKRAEINKLQKRQLDLCNSLGKEPNILKEDPLPSPEELEKFESHIERLETEKFNRLEKFSSVKVEILKIIDELELEPSTQFEKNVFSSDDSLFVPTDENMKQLDQLQKSLIKQEKNVKEEVTHLRNRIDDYWNLLDVDLKEREDFRQKYVGYTLDVLEALRTEVKRCEELKKANIKVFVDKLRSELEQLWKKCHCTEAVKMQFSFFYSDCYNEDLLELHEVEIKKWKRYFEENKELLSLLDKHQFLWKKMMELDERATGPNRYNNRGGQLLKEEKERNKLSKQIPQIEETLYNLAEKYKEHHNISFTSYGSTVEDYLANLHEERENAKKQKLSARKMQREQTLTPAKSALSLFPSTSQHTLKPGTPLCTTKRKIFTTPRTEETKRPKVLSARKPANKIEKTPTPVIQITSVSGRTKRLSVERRKRLDKIRRRSAHKGKNQVNSNETFSADYSDFQSQLSNRDDCRSTILPSEATPVSTPMSLRKRTPTNIAITTPRTPNPRTPNRRLAPRTPDITNKLSAAKPNIKLIF